MGAVWSNLLHEGANPLRDLIRFDLIHLSPHELVQKEPYYSSNTRQLFPDHLFDRCPEAPSSTRKTNISYEYDEQKHLVRQANRLQAGGLETRVPVGWPEALKGPLVWTTPDYQEEHNFVYTLSESNKAEIRDALRYFKGLSKKGSLADKASFPLPKLEHTLTTIRKDLYRGRGFATLRGLDVDALSPDDLGIIYLGISSYVAEKRGMQNREGTMMINVTRDPEEIKRESRYIEMPFHTDLCCDVLALLTVACGAEGGAGVLTSGWTVYNELAKSRPDLIHVLAEPNWPFDTHGRDPPYYKRALLYLEDGRLLINFSRRLLVGRQYRGVRTPGIPELSEAQAEALDALHEIGRRHEIKHTTMKGDIRFINNLALMHRRDTFVDSMHDHRHLLRLWLHNPDNCWRLPMDLELAWHRIFNHDERREHWHFVQFSPGSERHIEALWQASKVPRNVTTYTKPGTGSGSPRPPVPGPPDPPPPPTQECD